MNPSCPNKKRHSHLKPLIIAVGLAWVAGVAPAAETKSTFHLEEATIADIQQAILAKQLTSTELVKLYLARVKAYNGTAVEQPKGILGPIKTIPHAGQLNALGTLNLRPATRKAWGFDDRKARSMTDAVDNDPAMPDALEVAAREDAEFARTGKLVGPLHGVVIAIKDQFDTFDMRTTSGSDVAYANDRPPHDATFAQRLRDAGAIILGKANMGEYAGGYGGDRSSFGGTTVNPYDTERTPGASSAGSGVAVAANFVTCAIGEETSPSIRAPAQNNNSVGISPTQELVSRVGMMNIGINTRIGPIARTVEDAARILTVIAGYDPKDEMTAFNVGRTPDRPYESFTHETSLKGIRIGVVREYMDTRIATPAEAENIALAERAIEDLRRLGATIVDPGPEGLFTEYVRRYNPMLSNSSWTKLFPEMFPVDENGKPKTDQIATLVELAADPSKVPGKLTIRDFPPAPAIGESTYGYNLYLKQRGDANIKTLDDLIHKAWFYNDGESRRGKPTSLISAASVMQMDTAVRLQRRFAIQQIILQCMAELKLDAFVAPTGNIPPAKIGAPRARGNGGAGGLGTWSFLGQQGIPAITVPAGFTTQVYDLVPDSSARPSENTAGRNDQESMATKLVGPFPDKLPVGIDFMGRPFSEPILLTIAAAYESATRHRMPPPDFGPLPAIP
jgi:Asp-tRNA(Asn)/Glu-tRNA(Gln) amidotransferase A subunit family amidase